MDDLKSCLQHVLANIADVCAGSGRSPGSVQLTIASKTQSAERILPLLEGGHRIFGENRVQEAYTKWPQLKQLYPDLELHMIGPLQSNKAEDAVKLFDVIETVDRISLAKSLSKAMKKLDKRVRMYVEVNVGREAQKAGIAPGDASGFVARCRAEYGLEIEGLMCIPPADQPPAQYFQLLATIAAANGLKELSMGMSGDFADAIQHGATHVRLGTAIFGARASN